MGWGMRLSLKPVHTVSIIALLILYLVGLGLLPSLVPDMREFAALTRTVLR